jgi:hypothetical protein
MVDLCHSDLDWISVSVSYILIVVQLEQAFLRKIAIKFFLLVNHILIELIQ